MLLNASDTQTLLVQQCLLTCLQTAFVETSPSADNLHDKRLTLLRKSPVGSGNSTAESCEEQDHWRIFFSSSFIVFVAGLMIMFFIDHPPKSRCKQPDENIALKVTNMFWSKLLVHCEILVSGQNISGKIVLILSVALSLASFLLYLVDASRYNPAFRCLPWYTSRQDYVDLAFNCFFVVFFFLRLLAARDKVWFWISLASVVDIFTVPPVFVGIYLNRQWLGLRFLRGMRLLLVPDILQYTGIIKTNDNIRLVQVATLFISILLCAAGFVHWVETAGDLFKGYIHNQYFTYWDYVYYIMVTMTTIGYGDINCRTLMGRLFISCFMVVALAIFGYVIPVLVEIFGNRDKFGGEYELSPGIRHVVVCGHITYQSVINFQQDFMHEERVQIPIKYVFLDEQKLGLDMEALFKRYFRHIQFFRGTIMKSTDLARVKLSHADACIILANHRPTNPDEEDANNVMRVISIKNSLPELRILVELNLYSNKSFCINLPNWSLHDHVICLSEVKLGFMAQGCLARGCSTLLANLFVPRTIKPEHNKDGNQTYQLYSRGASLEVYTSQFSPSFYYKPFPEVVKICYSRLNILLIAASESTSEDAVVFLNPSEHYLIRDISIGFIVCDQETEVFRVLYYCEICYNADPQKFLAVCKACDHLDKEFESTLAVSADPQKRWSCLSPSCRDSVASSYPTTDFGDISLEIHHEKPPGLQSSQPLLTLENFDNKRKSTASLSDDILYSATEKFDSTGLFHWCPSRTFQESLLENNPQVLKNLKDHIIVCMFKTNNSPLLGLNNFVMPLRVSSLGRLDVKPIVFLGNEGYLRKEWDYMSNLPHIYIKVGSPSRANLRALNVYKCHMCVVLSGGETSSGDDTLRDKEAILCTLDIKTMKFYKQAQSWQIIPSALLKHIKKGHKSAAAFRKQRLSLKFTGDKIPMITELAADSNVEFIDQDDEDDPTVPLYMTQPYACGRAFTSSVLDSILATAFFYPETFGLIRALVTGTTASQVENIMAEGMGLTEGFFSEEESFSLRGRCRLMLLDFSSDLLESYYIEHQKQPTTYGQLLLRILDDIGIMLIGMYRKLHLDDMSDDGLPHRLVITNPPSNVVVHNTDEFYVLIPYGYAKKSLSNQTAVNSVQQHYLAQQTVSAFNESRKLSRPTNPPPPSAAPQAIHSAVPSTKTDPHETTQSSPPAHGNHGKYGNHIRWSKLVKADDVLIDLGDTAKSPQPGTAERHQLFEDMVPESEDVPHDRTSDHLLAAESSVQVLISSEAVDNVETSEGLLSESQRKMPTRRSVGFAMPWLPDHDDTSSISVSQSEHMDISGKSSQIDHGSLV